MREVEKIRKEHPYWFWFVVMLNIFNGTGLVLLLLSNYFWEDQPTTMKTNTPLHGHHINFLKTSQQNLLNAIKEKAKLEKAGFFNEKYELEEKFTNGYNQAMNDFIKIISK